METPDVLIIGGGIIGCALARELAHAHLQVIVVERGLVGSGASSAAAGLLSPAFGAVPTGPLADLCYQSAAMYETWIEELRLEDCQDVGFRRHGLLEVWRDRREEEQGRRNLDHLPSGYAAAVLSVDEIRRLEPNLAGATVGGVLYPNDAQVDAARLTQTLARICHLAGATIHENQPVMRVAREGDRITAVHTVSSSYWPGIVVVAAGAWSGGLAEAMGLDLPTHPVKGQLLQAQARVSPVRRPVHAGSALFVPLADGSLVLGVTVEDVGFDEQVTLHGVGAIIRDTCALYPGVAGLPLARAWAGLRPATPDGLPYMGPLEPLSNLWVSTGHFRKGILLAPLCGQLVAQSILADEVDAALLPFKPTRRPAC
jgi:glycine oxidase